MTGITGEWVYFGFWAHLHTFSNPIIGTAESGWMTICCIPEKRRFNFLITSWLHNDEFMYFVIPKVSIIISVAGVCCDVWIVSSSCFCPLHLICRAFRMRDGGGGYQEIVSLSSIPFFFSWPVFLLFCPPIQRWQEAVQQKSCKVS